MEKSANAGGAGAVAAVIYNNVDGPIAGITLGVDIPAFGSVVPTIGLDRAKGLEIVESVSGGTEVVGDLFVEIEIMNTTT